MGCDEKCVTTHLSDQQADTKIVWLFESAVCCRPLCCRDVNNPTGHFNPFVASRAAKPRLVAETNLPENPSSLSG